MTAPKVLEVVLELEKTEHDRRQGILTATRRDARRFCLDAYGWRVTRTEVEKSLELVAVIRCSEAEVGKR